MHVCCTCTHRYTVYMYMYTCTGHSFGRMNVVITSQVELELWRDAMLYWVQHSVMVHQKKVCTEGLLDRHALYMPGKHCHNAAMYAYMALLSLSSAQYALVFQSGGALSFQEVL